MKGLGFFVSRFWLCGRGQREAKMFRKVLLVLIVAAVAIAIPAAASAVYSLLDYQSATDSLLAVDPTIDPPPNDPNRDFAVGGFQGPVENSNWGVSGHSGPSGENPQGHASETIPGAGAGTFQARWRVICVAVMGKEAALGLVPTDTASNDQPDPFVLALFDGGPSGRGDAFAVVNQTQVSPYLCLDGIGLEFFPVEHGNILINDALPLP
jgi:hypothetical protein